MHKYLREFNLSFSKFGFKTSFQIYKIFYNKKLIYISLSLKIDAYFFTDLNKDCSVL